MSDQQLMKLFDFDESELTANRNGRLSEKQKARLQKNETKTKKDSLTIGLFYGFIAILGPVIAIGSYFLIGSEGLVTVAIFAVIFGLIWPLIWGAFASIFIRRAFSKMEAQVKKAEGPVNIVKAIHESYNASTKTHSEYSAYELRVGRRAFEVEAEAADAMMQGDVYAVYYADIDIESSEDPILSAELVDKAKNGKTL